MTDLDRLHTAHARVAVLVLLDKAYAPLFERLEAEIRRAGAMDKDDPIARARATIAAQDKV